MKEEKKFYSNCFPDYTTLLLYLIGRLNSHVNTRKRTKRSIRNMEKTYLGEVTNSVTYQNIGWKDAHQDTDVKQLTVQKLMNDNSLQFWIYTVKQGYPVCSWIVILCTTPCSGVHIHTHTRTHPPARMHTFIYFYCSTVSTFIMLTTTKNYLGLLYTTEVFYFILSTHRNVYWFLWTKLLFSLFFFIFSFLLCWVWFITQMMHASVTL